MVRKNPGPGPGAYMLPTTIGAKNHDFSRYKNPEYSMGIVPPSLSKFQTPGPHYEVSKLTKYGKVSPPAYSLSFRQKDLTAFKPPGPGTYSPEKCPRMKEQRPPAYSIASRHKDLAKFNTPGPNQYPLPTTIGPKVPDLPTAGAYTMGGIHDLSSQVRSPGPAKYGITDCDVNKHRAPKYSISPKTPLLSDKSKNPGPAGYFPNLPKKCNAGFQFGQRTENEPYITADDNMPCVNR